MYRVAKKSYHFSSCSAAQTAVLVLSEAVLVIEFLALVSQRFEKFDFEHRFAEHWHDGQDR